MLTREQILGADDLKPEPVEVPEWGLTVFVRMLFGDEREALEARRGAEKSRIFPVIVALATCNEQGDPLFTDEDVQALAKKNFKAVHRVAQAAIRFNKLSTADLDAAEGN